MISSGRLCHCCIPTLIYSPLSPQFPHAVRTIISTLWAICLKKCCHCASVCPSVCLSVCASYVFSLPGEITTKQRWLPLALDQQNVHTSDAPPVYPLHNVEARCLFHNGGVSKSAWALRAISSRRS